MGTIFMNSENSKNYKSHVLILKLTNKLDLRIGKKVIALSILGIYYTWKNKKLIQKKNYDPFLWMGFNCLKARATLRGQFSYLLPLSSQKLLVLILSTSEG